MRPIRSATLMVLASAVLAATLTGCQLAREQAAGEIHIAADLELSGSAATVGKAYQRALELKVDQLNKSGALNGRKIVLEVRDNRSDPSESLRNITDFTTNPAVSAIIMGGCNECAVGAARTLNDKRVPAIALAPAHVVSNPIDQRRYVFKLAPNAADTAAALATELRHKGVKKVALLHTDDSYGQEGVTALASELAKAKIQLTRAEPVKATDSDVSRAMTSLTSTKPDGLVIWTSAEQAMLAAGEAKQSGYRGALFFDAAAAGDLFLGGAADNTTMVFTQTMVIDDVIATTPAKAARKQWFRDYTARFGGYYGFSSFAADAVQLITDAAVRTGGSTNAVNRDGIRDVLETSQTDGLSGPIRMTPDNHSGLMAQALTTLVARGGRWRLAG